MEKNKADLKAKEQNAETRHYSEKYEMKEDMLQRMLKGNLFWVEPELGRFQICKLCHNDCRHPLYERTLERIRRDYWFPKMTEHV